eukprot:6017411-Alexandrium_andersonii.AAC.1
MHNAIATATTASDKRMLSALLALATVPSPLKAQCAIPTRRRPQAAVALSTGNALPGTTKLERHMIAASRSSRA